MARLTAINFDTIFRTAKFKEIHNNFECDLLDEVYERQ